MKSSSGNEYPKAINTKSKRALYDNLGSNEQLALAIDGVVKEYRYDGWRGNRFKERVIRNHIKQALERFDITDEREIEKVMNLVRNQDEY